MRDSCATCEILDCHDDDICGLIEFRRKRRSHYAAGSSHQTGAASKRVKHTKTGRPGVGGVGGRPSAVLVHVFLSKLLTRVSKTTLFVWAFFSYWQGRRPLFFGSQKEGAEVVAFRIFADNLFPSTPPPLTPFLLSEGEIINHRTSFHLLYLPIISNSVRCFFDCPPFIDQWSANCQPVNKKQQRLQVDIVCDD